jgi:hypothetical protein
MLNLNHNLSKSVTRLILLGSSNVSGDEQGQATFDNGGNDCNGQLMMCQFTFAQHKDLLHDPNIWLGDSGALTHSTAYQNGMVNMVDATSSDGTIVGNNQVNAVESIGDIPGIFCCNNAFHRFFGTFSTLQITYKSSTKGFTLTVNDSPIDFLDIHDDFLRA